MSQPLLAPCDLKRLLRGIDCGNATAAAGLDLEQPRRSLREWFGSLRAVNRTLWPSISTPDLALVMWRIDQHRAARALAAVLEVVLSPEDDPRSLAVIPLLRAPEQWATAREVWMATLEAKIPSRGTWAAVAAIDAARAVMEAFAPWVRGAVNNAMRSRIDIDFGPILLDGWEAEAEPVPDLAGAPVAEEPDPDELEARCRSMQAQVRAHAFSTVHSLMMAMLNPKRRGPNWKWADLPAEAAEDAVSTIGLSLPLSDEEWERIRATVEEDVREAAQQFAESALERSGILEWWPDTSK